MPGSWLDPLDQLKHRSRVVVTSNNEYHLRTPGGRPYCNVVFTEAYLMVLPDAEEDDNLLACHTCFPKTAKETRLPKEKEDERQMKMFQ